MTVGDLLDLMEKRTLLQNNIDNYAAPPGYSKRNRTMKELEDADNYEAGLESMRQEIREIEATEIK